MQFDSSYITTAGSELFARATASANSSVSMGICIHIKNRYEITNTRRNESTD